MARLKVNLNRKLVMSVHRRILKKKKLVYLLTATSPVKYREGKSRIVYIGTTKKGARRIASSAAGRAEQIMSTRGLREVSVFVVSCTSCPGVPTWRRLEDALLAVFRSEYGQLPMCNSQGQKKKWDDELDERFKRRAIEKVVRHFSDSVR